MRLWLVCSLWCYLCGSVAHAQFPITEPSVLTACQFSNHAQQDIQQLNQRFILMSHFFKYRAEQFYFVSDPSNPQLLLGSIPIKKIIYATQSSPSVSLITFDIESDLDQAKRDIEKYFDIQLNQEMAEQQYTAHQISAGTYKTYGLSQQNQRVFFYCGVRTLL